MTWTASNTLALAAQDCTSCNGTGQKSGRGASATPCNCVLRSVFRACFDRFKSCASKEKHISRASLEFSASPKGRRATWGRKDEEYMADFILVSRRHLTEAEYRVFKAHFLLGADWRLCCRQLKMDRGNFFHMVYRIQQNLGRVFGELQPYALYPLDEYFGHSTRREEEVSAPKAEKVVPITAFMKRKPETTVHFAPTPVRKAA